MTLSIHRRPFLGRLARAPKVFVQNYRNLRPYARGRWDAFATAFRTTWILVRPLVDESRCRVCKDSLFGDRGPLCPRCAVPAGFIVTLSLLALFVAALATFGCASHPPRYRFHYETPLPAVVESMPWCHEVLAPTPGGHCLVCLDEKGDREQIGRGSGEPCLKRVLATWGPAPKETTR